MARPTVYEFEVQGSGTFPVDMLRYDCCWPAREMEDSYRGIGEPDPSAPVRTVRLHTIRETATNGRWASFGWIVTKPPQAPR